MIRGEIIQQNTGPLGHNFRRTAMIYTHVVNLDTKSKKLIRRITDKVY